MVIAGYTGSDPRAVQAHIDELAAIGVPPPPSVPRFYLLDPALLTTRDVIEVASDHTSGEVEPVLLRAGGRYFLGVGSDHTDRALERSDVAAAKATCPKPVGSTVVELSPGPSAWPNATVTIPCWEDIAIASTADGASYQRGSLDALLPPDVLLGRLMNAVDGLRGDLVMFGGTVPLLTPSFITSTDWELTLEVPGTKTITHRYHVERKCEWPNPSGSSSRPTA